ncbi:MAG: alpha/beta fold hydrolase [Solirubrobacterales bacterium]
MPSVEVQSRELFYERHGAGPPVLMIVGMGGYRKHWGENFLDLIAAEREAIIYDHRGTGRSEDVGEPFYIRDLADDAVGLLAALEIAEADVIAISMGGMVAQQLALTYPHRIRKLVVGCTYCGATGDNLTPPEVWQPLVDALSEVDTAEAQRDWWQAQVSAAFATKDTPWQRFEQLATDECPDLEVIFQQLKACTGFDVCDELGQIDIPTLVIHGEGDQILPIAQGALIADRIPGAELMRLRDCGHMWWWEHPEQTAGRINQFLG